MEKLKVSGVAKGQYKQLCPLSWSKCNKNEKTLVYKIRRAVDLGRETHTYSNGCKIVRYYYHNFLVSDSEIMTMWKDESRQPHNVSEQQKQLHKKKVYGDKEMQTYKPLIAPPSKEDLTEEGFNKNIRVNPKQTVEKLVKYGFTNYREPCLYYGRYLGNEIGFSITVDKETLEIERLDVLDEDFCQPYNYQSILMKEPTHEFARDIYNKVNNILGKLQNDEVIEGFEVGMYV